MSYSSLRELREEILRVLKLYIKENKQDCLKPCEKGDEFYFKSCQTFVISTQMIATNLYEFYEIIKNIDINSIYFHMFDARLRLKTNENDFTLWLKEQGYENLSKKILKFDPYTMTLENLRIKLMKFIEMELKR